MLAHRCRVRHPIDTELNGVDMKLALTILTAVALWGCAQAEPTSPTVAKTPSTSPATTPPTGSADVMIWLMVVDQSGVCIPGATIQVVAGQAVGQPIAQETPCSVWDYSGGVEYHHLSPGVSMTLRATTPGYVTEEKTITPVEGPVSVIDFAPLPVR